MNWYSLICVLVAQNCGQQIVRLDHHSERLIVVVRLLYARSCTAFCRSCDSWPQPALQDCFLLRGDIIFLIQSYDWLSNGINPDSVWIKRYRSGHTATNLRFEHRREELLSQILLSNVLLLLVRTGWLLLGSHFLGSCGRVGTLRWTRTHWFDTRSFLRAARLSFVFYFGQVSSLTVPT